MKTLLFSADDIASTVRAVGVDRLMDETIDALASACLSAGQGQFQTPVRDGFHYDDEELGLLEWMPVLERDRHATVKVVGYHPANPVKRKLPTILSVVMRFDTDSGHLATIIDGTFATALRTGAASALASRILASEHATTLGLIGCGAQAVTQLHAISREFPLSRVLVFDVDPAAAGSFAARVAPLGLDGIVEIASPEAIAAASDIISTATSVGIGAAPVIADRELAAHVHINAVGSDFPGKIELPRSVLTRSLVCPDFLDQALREGECQQLARDQIGPDLATLVLGDQHDETWRTRSTVFDSTGWALEDHVVVGLLSAHAVSLGLGTEVQIEAISTDPSNPYALLEETAAATPDGRWAVVR